MAEFRVFYSWQSDLPNGTNRGFIEKALQEAATAIGGDASVEVEPVIDRDTAGVPGTPDIAHTILDKIGKSDVFACDVSIINAAEESRQTPNPNVLVELGYALKSLGTSRIVLIMNTAFGGPELLPFDLRMKRVTPYEARSQDTDKSKERQRLSCVLENALRAIISEAAKTAPKAIPSGNKLSLKSECEAILKADDLEQWRYLVNVVTGEILDELVEWIGARVQTWDKIAPDGQRIARFEALETCLRGFVPIFTAAEKGREEWWQESIGILRELALLRDRMRRGGFTDVLEIGSHVLYFAGNIGMAVATRAKQLSLTREWLRLPMPAERDGELVSVPWLQVRHAHRLWGRCMPGNRAPFEDILKACESDYLQAFDLGGEKSRRFLFMGNLVQSLFELGCWIEDGQRLKALEAGDGNELWHRLGVWPLWGLMDHSEFRSATWTLFGSAEGVRQFVFPGNGISPERLWGWWKMWKEVCVGALMRGELQFSAPRMLHAQWLTLPGEPAN